MVESKRLSVKSTPAYLQQSNMKDDQGLVNILKRIDTSLVRSYNH